MALDGAVAGMSGSVIAAFRVIDNAMVQLDKAVALLRAVTADTEPAPVSIVLTRATNGKVHRAARIHGIKGLMTYEADNLDDAVFEVIPDLSTVHDEDELCSRCFGPLDEQKASERPDAPSEGEEY